jgi:hypothetical protein
MHAALDDRMLDTKQVSDSRSHGDLVDDLVPGEGAASIDGISQNDASPVYLFPLLSSA